MLKNMDRQEILGRFQQFAQLPAERKLENFPFKAPAMCSDEWRKKIEQFLQEGPKGSEELADEVFAHLQLSVFDGERATSACVPCRTAFWQLVWLSTDVDGH